jgi:fructose-specific PTS system IIA-like component
VPTEFSFNFPLPNGLHARPASAFEEAARPFACEITFINDRTDAQASVKSVLGMVSTGTLPGDPCRIVFDGADEASAREELRRFVAEKLPHCDDPPLESIKVPGEISLPPCLRDAGAVLWKAKSAAPGIGIGRIVRLSDAIVPDDRGAGATVDAPQERECLLNALLALDRTYAERMKEITERVALGLLQAHRAMARDPALKAWLLAAISGRNCTATQAVLAAQDHFAGVFTASASTLLRERALDVRDVCRQLIRELKGSPPGPPVVLTRDSIVTAEGLTPSDLLGLDRRFLKGLALAKIGAASHTVILARSFGIPCVIDIADFPVARWEGQDAIVDGELGLLAVGLTADARRYYEMEQWRLNARHVRAQRLTALPGQTADGARLEIASNISRPDEAAPAIAAGAESIGLFRTEMLFMDRNEAPGEEEQYQAYSRALRDAGGRTVIIRTLDIGGDKPVAWLKLPAEQNPMLGSRGARLYPRIESLIRTQIRALLRASVNGQLRVMIPMIAGVAEARWVKRVFDEERARLVEQGTRLDSVPLGAMVEIPSAAFELNALCHELDFFSIGSNDLIHYFTATDRGTSTALDDPLAPAFLRLLKKIVDDSHAASRWIGLCGEMGGNVQCLPLLVGLGLDEISVPIASVAAIKDRLAPLMAAECRRLLTDALDCTTADEVRTLMQQREPRRPIPLFAEEFVVLDSRAATKAEAIKTLCDTLYVTGRTDSPRQIEDAIWKREAVYSTGFGYGCAIPHCKTGAVAANSLCILRSQEPIPWGDDGASASVIILLALRDNDEAAEHLKIISRLARLLMHETFRENLISVKTPAAMTAFLAEQIGLSASKNPASAVLNLEV